MAKLALQARDSLSLAYTKFKIRRIRTALTLISTSVLALILVVGSCVVSGFMDLANSTPQSSLTDMHLAKSQRATVWLNDSVETPPFSAQSERDALASKVKDPATLKNVFFDVSVNSGSPTVTFEPVTDPARTSSESTPSQTADDTFEVGNLYTRFRARSPELLTPFMDPSQNIDWKAGDPIPVFVSSNVLLEAHLAEFVKLKTAKARVAKREELKKAVLGKSGNFVIETRTFQNVEELNKPVQSETSTTTIQARIVGFVPGTSIFGDNDDSGVYMVPLNVAQAHPELSSSMTRATAVYPSFTTTKARNAFANDEANNASIYADVIEENKEYSKPVMRVFNIAVIVMLILMAIPMAATISKLLSDSQRETGVFRAIGARNRNIVSIYGLYSLLMVTAAFIFAVIAGESICAWLTARYGDDLELAAADYAEAIVNASFVQFNLRQMATIYGGLIAGAALGIAIPMIRALRRDPIKALRDE